MVAETLTDVVVASTEHLANLNQDLETWRKNLEDAPTKMMEAASAKNIAEFTKWSEILRKAEGEIKSLEAKIRKESGTPANNAAAESAIKGFEESLAKFLTGPETVALV